MLVAIGSINDSELGFMKRHMSASSSIEGCMTTKEEEVLLPTSAGLPTNGASHY